MTTSPPWWRSWRAAVGVAVLLAQLVVIVIAHTTGCCAARYFAWAPNDYSVDYHATATVNGHLLSPSAFQTRYEVGSAGFWEDPVARLEHLLRRREQLYGGTDRVQLVVRYRLDGHRQSTWRWSGA
jgi:hypothetical protein